MTRAGAFDALLRAHPLPDGWRVTETHADEVQIGEATIARAAIAAERDGAPAISGSAASRRGDPTPRAYYELLERLAIVAAAEPMSGDARRREARSNGVALHSSFEAAAEGARLELLERHRLLHSWSGSIAPTRVETPEALSALSTHEWRCSALGAPDEEGAVVAVLGLPRSEDMPLARGFGAGASLAEALDVAAREAVQSLSFLVGEEIPTAAPPPAPSPLFHLDHYLYPPHHPILTAWLDGERVRAERSDATGLGVVELRDLTPQGWSSFRVVRATSPSARRVFFGEPGEGDQESDDPGRFHPIS